MHCVNALSRAYPISTSGGSSIIKKHICVNALSRAYPISTALRQVQRHQRKIRVNALSRAYPISTVSLKKPAKINGFQTRF